MKGQTAVEYLMTYGWAILIILIVAGVLAYYGIFSPAGFLSPTARGFGQVQVLNPWSITTAGTITLHIENRVGGDITSPVVTTVIGSNPSNTCTPTNVTIISGGTAVITCPLSPAPVGAVAGQSYTATTTIRYVFQGQQFTSTGTISGSYS